MSNAPAWQVVPPLFVAFWSGYLLILALPGPNMLVVATIAGLKGARGTVPLALGLAAGVALLAAAIFAAAASVPNDPAVDAAGRWIAAALLCSLAWRVAAPLWRRDPAPARHGPALAGEFGAGFCTAVTNPISVSFFATVALSRADEIGALEWGVLVLSAALGSFLKSMGLAALIGTVRCRLDLSTAARPLRFGVALALVVVAAGTLGFQPGLPATVVPNPAAALPSVTQRSIP